MLVLFFSVGALPLSFLQLAPVGAAWADDDDGGGDDNDDGGGNDNDDDGGSAGGGRSDDDDGGSTGAGQSDDDDGRSRAGGRDDDDDNSSSRAQSPRQGGGLFDLFRRPSEPSPQPRRAQAPRPAPPPPPEFASNEIVALALNDIDLDTLLAQGFGLIEEIPVPGLAAVPRRLSVPNSLSLVDARAAVRALPSGTDADFNHYYRSEQGFDADCQGSDCPARLMIDWPLPPEREGTCGSSSTIGMIDTGINENHETFQGARIEVTREKPESFDPSRAIHGTAVAALLVGHPDTRSPGLVPGARLIAVDAFYRAGGDERADIFTLVRALGLLADQDVDVINLSLAGPDNTVLLEVVERLVFENDIVVVSAVGNSGSRAEPEFPAAYDPVIAVTAVDRDGAIYRRAVQGPHVDLAAPGVNIWTAASISGARWKTGTSFAVPFVTAAAAILRENQPDLAAESVEDALRQRALDLGEPGEDSVFGAGLLSIAGLCDDPS
ncbi:MAG: S8 family serine peptidase [Pelagibaca sp.]